MSEQEVTYSELKFHTPTQQQSRQRAEITKNKDSPSPLWRLFAVIFGILCLALLVTSGLLGALVCRWQQNFSQQQGILENLTCQQINLENQTRELQEILENLTWERDHLQIQNTNFLKTLQSKGWKFLCPEYWFPHGEKCYHFSTESKPWLESQKACSSHDSRLLLIENKEELDFISPLATFHWIGLSRDKTDRPWMWVNGTAFSTDQFVVKKGYVDGNCALVTGGELYSGPCKESKRYICEQLVLLPKPDIST
ncbi:oxidized low-density lipoprotein receptor 1-like [Mauremys reevesii]|uniref:oxidized low-density lipoprotein receptor 1-like n=1 Tax=Mauremys reevesii TaxID=260615 RepID=UPI00193EE410|nr:oxidized low-density lipoprotein receptor 1-like [Mauremys reevesii]